jgi:hypothetical protein
MTPEPNTRLPLPNRRRGYRGWTRIKNPTYWRRAMEVELIQRRRRVGLPGA